LHVKQASFALQVPQPAKQATHGLVPKQAEHPKPATSRKPVEHKHVLAVAKGTLLTVSLHDVQASATVQAAQPAKQAVHVPVVAVQGVHPSAPFSLKPALHTHVLAAEVQATLLLVVSLHVVQASVTVQVPQPFRHTTSAF